MNFGARWQITDVEEGLSVIYENFENGIVFDCGVTRKDTPFDFLLSFIVSEGDPGDLVYFNGILLFQTQKEIKDFTYENASTPSGAQTSLRS